VQSTQNFPVDRLLNSCNACVCEDFLKMYEFHWYDKKQPDFVDKRENQ
jgi:hypothetical protein